MQQSKASANKPHVALLDLLQDRLILIGHACYPHFARNPRESLRFPQQRHDTR